jgi:SAM-dependent methyltransferase
MPDCQDCARLTDGKCSAYLAEWVVLPVNSVRACVVAISEEYCRLIQPGMRVLEIGCGTWSPIQQHCAKLGVSWEGIDASDMYFGERTIATRIESVEALSFEDESFELVIGNQTLEHWNESGCRPEIGIWQCFRVCKVGGRVLMNVPIHFHGSRIFVEGDMAAIDGLFRPFSSEVKLEPWRKRSAPLSAVYLNQGYRVTGEPVSYTLDVRATRKAGLPPRPSGYTIHSRAWRELMDHRWSYLLWKAGNHLRLATKRLV